MHIVIKRDIRPHEILLHAIFLLAGITGLIIPLKVSGAILAALPTPSLYLFYAVLTVGSIGVIAGSFLKGIAGRLTLIYALMLIAVNLAGYGIAILGIVGVRGFFFGLMTIGIAVANSISGWQTWREIRQYQAGQRALNIVLEEDGGQPR